MTKKHDILTDTNKRCLAATNIIRHILTTHFEFSFLSLSGNSGACHISEAVT